MAEMTPEEREWLRAWNALLLEVDSNVAMEINKKHQAVLRAAVQAERESCAEIAESRYDRNTKHVLADRKDGRYISAATWGYRAEECKAIAAAIRARGKEDE